MRYCRYRPGWWFPPRWRLQDPRYAPAHPRQSHPIPVSRIYGTTWDGVRIWYWWCPAPPDPSWWPDCRRNPSSHLICRWHTPFQTILSPWSRKGTYSLHHPAHPRSLSRNNPAGSASCRPLKKKYRSYLRCCRWLPQTFPVLFPHASPGFWPALNTWRSDLPWSYIPRCPERSRNKPACCKPAPCRSCHRCCRVFPLW